MGCFKRGDVAGLGTRKVVVLGHDARDPLRWLYVKFPRTRHISRVDPVWLRRLNKK